MNINDTFMSWAEVCATQNKSKPTIWRWVQKKAFPQPVYRQVDGLLLGFRRTEVEHYCRTGEVTIH